MSEPSPIDPSRLAAREAGLRYATDEAPGFTRRRRGRGFSYHDQDGNTIRDPEVIARIRSRERAVVVVSARTGEGLAELQSRIEELLPHPDIDVEVLLPYGRGDLVSKVHDDGTVLVEEHLAEGTRISARVHPALAGELTGYAV